MAQTTMADLLKQAEEAGISSFTPSEGPGTFEVVNANASKTKKGDPKFGIQWSVKGGPEDGKKFWTNINLIASKNDGTPNSMGLAMSFKDLAVLGADASVVAGWDPDSANASEQVADAVVGAVVTADISVRESGGYTNIDLKKMKRVPGAAAPAPAASAAAASPADGTGTAPLF